MAKYIIETEGGEIPIEVKDPKEFLAAVARIGAGMAKKGEPEEKSPDIAEVLQKIGDALVKKLGEISEPEADDSMTEMCQAVTTGLEAMSKEIKSALKPKPQPVYTATVTGWKKIDNQMRIETVRFEPVTMN